MTKLSARQYQLARTLLESRHDFSRKQAGEINQTTFNSFARRKYIQPRANGFAITQELIEAMQEFQSAEIYRKLPGVELGRWASQMLDEYDKRSSRRARLHQVVA